MDVMDCHVHAFPDALAARAVPQLEAGARYYPVRAYSDGTVSGLLNAMNAAGVRRALVSSVATRPGQVRSITDWSAGVASERLVPFASIHPDYPAIEDEVERIASLGLRGIKFHPQYMNCPADDPRTLRLARAAQRHNLAMMFHAGLDLAFEPDDLASPMRLRLLHEAVPGLRLLAGHLGGWRMWEQALRELAGRAVYLDTSFCLGQIPQPLLERILQAHPREYLLFGTDSPWVDIAQDLAAFRRLPLSPEAMQAALWDNARRFIDEQ